MRVAWFGMPTIQCPGGAEISERLLRAAAPDGAEVTEGFVGSADVVVDHAGRRLAEELPAPRVLIAHDGLGMACRNREAVLRADVVVVGSELHANELGLCRCSIPYVVLPEVIDVERFLAVRDRRPRRGAVAVFNNFGRQKGVQRLVRWAEENREHVALYGGGTAEVKTGYVHGQGYVSHDELPEVLAQFEKFVYLPEEVEPFGMVVCEAKLAGLELVVDEGLIGAMWVLNRPDWIEVLRNAARDTWAVIEEVAKEGRCYED